MNRIERIWYTRLGDLLPFAAAAGVVALAGYFGRRPSSSVLMLFLALTPGLLLIQEPRLGLAALAALSFTLPLTIGTGGAVSLTAPVLIIPTVAAIWLVDGMRRRSLEIPPSRLWLPLGLFLVSGLLSWVAGLVYWDPLVPQPENLLLVQIGQWALYALSAAALFLGGTLGARGRWLRLAVAAFVIVGAGVLLQFFLPPLSRLLGWATPNMAHRSMFWVWLA